MSVAHEFFKDERIRFINSEEAMIFLINNYGSLLSMFRVIQAQIDDTKAKKIKAHNDLQKLREKMENLSKNKIQLTDEQKEYFEELRNYYVSIREEDDVVYFNGVPIELEEAAILLIRYQKIFKILEKFDRKAKLNIGKIVKRSFESILTPVRFCLSKTIHIKNESIIKDSLEILHDAISIFPSSIEETIIKDLNVDLSNHKPVV